MITYRNALKEDWKTIADLHARSWQRHYAGIWSEEYLNNLVFEERRAIWKKRFSDLNANQKIWLAEKEGILAGFCCIYLNDHENWGALLDNLHVDPKHQRTGIGHQFMKLAAECVLQNNDRPEMYLWVLTANDQAIKFYEKVGGVNAGSQLFKNPDGTHSDVFRFHWIEDHLGNL